MTATQVDERRRRLPAVRAPRAGLPDGTVALFAAMLSIILGAAGFIAYVLWPRWPGPAVATDAPMLPITVSGVAFNVPPAAMRRPVQRRPGAQERVDLAFLWPSLKPPAAPGKPPARESGRTPEQIRAIDRVFVTISAAGDALAPAERVRIIYPRYALSDPAAGPDGLAVLGFRDGSPYQGEDLVYDAQAPDHFLVRCTRAGTGEVPGTCLYQQRIGGADIVVRFPRDWLGDWRMVGDKIEALIASLRPSAS
jgi:hypothetical protein